MGEGETNLGLSYFQLKNNLPDDLISCHQYQVGNVLPLSPGCQWYCLLVSLFWKVLFSTLCCWHSCYPDHTELILALSDGPKVIP